MSRVNIEHVFIGLIVGIIMGMTGAGGALISIPLFLHLLGVTVKEATVLSLIAVILGTSVNLVGKKIKPDKKIVLPLVIFGTMANYASLPLKSMLPDMAIAALLFLIGVYSIWSVWFPNKKRAEKKASPGLVKTALIGIGLGIITTLTGLGGGVLLVPILINFFSKNYEDALPTSLLTILLISFISFLTQIETGLQLISLLEIAKLATGAMAAFLVLNIVLKKLNKEKLDLARKLIFTAVTVFSVVSVILKSI